MKVEIIGGGLAGVEACYQLLKRGVEVVLYEMRPKVMTPCHKSSSLCELVCSNSLKSVDVLTASGVLKEEMRVLDSLVLKSAERAKVPAGSSLSVNREIFSETVEKALYSFDNFTLLREEKTDFSKNRITIVATGPLTSDKMAEKIVELGGEEELHFFDAVAPIVSGDSIDMNHAFFASRYGKGEKSDYLNCPMSREEYEAFYQALVEAECAPIKDFESKALFEGCMPIEEMARRGKDTLRFGPLKPVGLMGENGEKYYAVVQLRRENEAGSMYNLVGFQTRLKFPEQNRVFSMIPALKNAEILRYGVMHRNTYLNAPKVLNEDFTFKNAPNIYAAGQMSGVEGYMESAVCGLMAGINAFRKLSGKQGIMPPKTTMTGALLGYVCQAKNNPLTPMNANFGVIEPLSEMVKDKKLKKKQYSDRAIHDIMIFKDLI